MAEKEHPAALAGRYLRAAGVAIQKELERRAGESEKAKAQPATAGDATAPDARAAQAQPEAPAAGEPSPAAARRARRAKPPLEPKPFVDRLLWLAFMVAMLSLALSGLQVQMLASGTAETVVRLVLGIPLVVVAILVLTNWQRANERLVARAFRAWGIESPTTKSGRLVRRFARDAMTLLGIVLLSVAAFQLLSAVVN
jgi:hypothetical protein